MRPHVSTVQVRASLHETPVELGRAYESVAVRITEYSVWRRLFEYDESEYRDRVPEHDFARGLQLVAYIIVRYIVLRDIACCLVDGVAHHEFLLALDDRGDVPRLYLSCLYYSVLRIPYTPTRRQRPPLHGEAR